jgi:galactoside O-acetyltransferase
MNSFYSRQELVDLGFSSVGENTLISRKASFYGAKNISIGDNVRIDDFCVLSTQKGQINIGNYVHLAVFVSVQGNGIITLEDFVGIGARVTILSSSDDFSGQSMANSCVPDEFKDVKDADVTLKKHSIVGAGTVILPGTSMAVGSAVGALSLVNKNCESFYIYTGNPIKKLFPRSQNILEIEKEFHKYLEENNL